LCAYNPSYSGGLQFEASTDKKLMILISTNKPSMVTCAPRLYLKHKTLSEKISESTKGLGVWLKWYKIYPISMRPSVQTPVSKYIS
jgi:hypothetical protein